MLSWNRSACTTFIVSPCLTIQQSCNSGSTALSNSANYSVGVHLSWYLSIAPPKGKLSTQCACAKISKKKCAPSGASILFQAQDTKDEDNDNAQHPTVFLDSVLSISSASTDTASAGTGTVRFFKPLSCLFLADYLQKRTTTNKIHLFYQQVTLNASGHLGNEGNKHYKCCHGNHKVFTVTKLMQGCLHSMYSTVIVD